MDHATKTNGIILTCILGTCQFDRFGWKKFLRFNLKENFFQREICNLMSVTVNLMQKFKGGSGFSRLLVKYRLK
jgi:hypothetical protein